MWDSIHTQTAPPLKSAERPLDRLVPFDRFFPWNERIPLIELSVFHSETYLDFSSFRTLDHKSKNFRAIQKIFHLVKSAYSLHSRFMPMGLGTWIHTKVFLKKLDSISSILLEEKRQTRSTFTFVYLSSSRNWILYSLANYFKKNSEIWLFLFLKKIILFWVKVGYYWLNIEFIWTKILSQNFQKLH